MLDQARITVNAPSALKDLRVLSWSTGAGDDQQWLATPRTNRVQRIADLGRQAAFLSSDFSYEDILKWQVDDYDYISVGRGTCPAGTCAIVDAKPRSRYSSYTRLKIYYDNLNRISQIDYFDDDLDKPVKTLRDTGYALQGQSWQPTRSVMTAHERETSTEVNWSGYQVDASIDERIMSPSTIAR